MTADLHQRIENLKRYLKGWEDAAARATAERDRLAELKDLGARLEDAEGNDILQKRMEQEDHAAREAHKAVVRLGAALGQAQAEAKN